MTAVRAFISHGSPDKGRFVLPFAERLRENGVDAWVDKWEIAPGDSLVDRIFVDGIAGASVFVVVLSKHTVDRPWVQEELDAAVVRRIEGSCKLIPIVLDGVDVPDSLKHVVWQTIADVDDYDTEFDAILRAVFGHRGRPPLGDPPAYTQDNISVGVLPEDAVTVLGIMAEQAIAKNDRFFGSFDPVVTAASARGLSEDAVFYAAARLGHDDYIDVTDIPGGNRVSHATLMWLGLLEWLKSTGVEIDSIGDNVATRLVNTDDRELSVLAAAVDQPLLIVDLVLESLEQQDLVTVGRFLGGLVEVNHVSPALRSYVE